MTLFTLVCGWGMLRFGKLSKAHGRLPAPNCVAACIHQYHLWHELFMNEVAAMRRQTRGVNRMKSRRLSRKERKMRSKIKMVKVEQTLVWPFMMV
ncbi:hypothetical protein BJP22_19135 [Aeromonas veronii]|nr:hypothetical protein BJP22_19135 [Aeromonas veronii]